MYLRFNPKNRPVHVMPPVQKYHRPRPIRRHGAFSLVEILVVIAIILVLMALLVPALKGIKGGSDVTKAAYDVAGVLENARAYAMANNTYTWVGFFEEDISKPTNPATEGIGRLVLSVVASKDGTSMDTSGAPSATPIDPTKLVQVTKLIKVDNIHLKTAGAGDSAFPVGTGGGDTFSTRPAVTLDTAVIGDTSPPDSPRPIQYPVGGTSASAAQYTFKKIIQFSPLGEARIISTDSTLKTSIEVGLQPSHGIMPDTNSKNVCAVQVTGIAGRVTIYRP